MSKWTSLLFIYIVALFFEILNLFFEILNLFFFIYTDYNGFRAVILEARNLGGLSVFNIRGSDHSCIITFSTNSEKYV